MNEKGFRLYVSLLSIKILKNSRIFGLYATFKYFEVIRFKSHCDAILYSKRSSTNIKNKICLNFFDTVIEDPQCKLYPKETCKTPYMQLNCPQTCSVDQSTTTTVAPQIQQQKQASAQVTATNNSTLFLFILKK